MRNIQGCYSTLTNKIRAIKQCAVALDWCSSVTVIVVSVGCQLCWKNGFIFHLLHHHQSSCVPACVETTFNIWKRFSKARRKTYSAKEDMEKSIVNNMTSPTIRRFLLYNLYYGSSLNISGCIRLLAVLEISEQDYLIVILDFDMIFASVSWNTLICQLLSFAGFPQNRRFRLDIS